jgi:Cof subfamily protein (haloacid dehalogenase superfamily)
LGKFKNILLISDMDGTLFTTKELKISENDIEALKRFKAQGGLFTIATGRCVESAGWYVKDISLTAPAILNNGSLIYDYTAKEILVERTLPESAKIALVKLMQAVPEAGVQIYSGSNIYIVRQNQQTIYQTTSERLAYIECSLDEVPSNWIKVLIAADEITMKKLMKFGYEFEAKDFYFVKTNTIYYEMIATSVTKGSAIKLLAEMVGIDILNTIAVGDYYNDVEMVNEAGFGIYTETAPEELKWNCDLVVRSAEFGAISDVIERLERGEILLPALV